MSSYRNQKKRRKKNQGKKKEGLGGDPYGATRDERIPVVIASRKRSFCAVVSAKGRERLMCKGRGAPRSLVKSDVRVASPLSFFWAC